MAKPRQFFKTDVPSTQKSVQTNRAVYRLPGKTKNGVAKLIVVECIEGGGNVPRNAATVTGNINKLDFKKELESVTAMARTALDAMKALSPGEVEIEFGIELGGTMGIPLITKTDAKANFKVTLKWQNQVKKGNGGK